jgi:hypothetical protein
MKNHWKNIFEPRTGIKCQLHSQSKLTTPRRENLKIRHENLSLKTNEHEILVALKFLTIKNIFKLH